MSLKQIAEKVGVSAATVSRILNDPNHKCADKDLRDKVFAAAHELNYVPNEAAKNLKMGKKSEEKVYLIDVLLTRNSSLEQDVFFNEVYRALEMEFNRKHCILSGFFTEECFSAEENVDFEKVHQEIDEMTTDRSEKSDGLIVLGKCNKSILKLLNERYKAVVSINRNSTDYAVDEVICDGAHIANLAMNYLIKLGHRRIGYVGSCHHESRYTGYLQEMFRHNLEPLPEDTMEVRHIESEGYKAMQHFLKQENPPTAFYCANDMVAIGMLKCLAKAKNKYYFPSIISSDDIEAAQFIKPMLTTVRIDKEAMARFATAILLDRIHGGHSESISLKIDGKLMIRESCTRVDEVNSLDYVI